MYVHPLCFERKDTHLHCLKMGKGDEVVCTFYSGKGRMDLYTIGICIFAVDCCL